MKNLKQTASPIFLSLFELIVGILLLINPVNFTVGIITAVGIALIVYGLISIIKYFRMDIKTASIGQTLTQGLGAILAGGFCAFKSEWFIVTFPVLTVLYGAGNLLGGLSKIQMAVDMFRQKNRKWFWAAISAALSIVCAIVILNSPFTSTAVLWMFTGISLIVEAVFDVITLIIGSRGAEDASV